jgi:hypothetical protein
MELSPSHAQARAQAARLPALYATLGLLVDGADRPVIHLLTGSDPDAGALVAAVQLAPGIGIIDEATCRLILTTPIEGQVPTGAGNVVGCARMFDAQGDWHGDLTVSDEAGDGEIKLQSLELPDGAFARITSGYFQG